MERQINLSHDDVDWFIPHQANKRIIDATLQQNGIGRFQGNWMNIQRSEIPHPHALTILLSDYEAQLKKVIIWFFAAFVVVPPGASIYLNGHTIHKSDTTIT